jgi:hypothetical protein
LAEIHPFLINDRSVLKFGAFKQFYERRNLPYISWVTLSEAGLLSLDDSALDILTFKQIRYADRVIVFTPRLRRTSLNLPITILSRPAAELLTIHEQPFDEQYVLMLAAYLHRHFADMIQWHPEADPSAMQEFDINTLTEISAMHLAKKES